MKVQLTQEKPVFTVSVEGVERLQSMVEESRWENFIKLKNVRGESLILMDEESPSIRSIAKALMQKEPEYTVVSGSRALLDTLKEVAPS